jgi:hypothetical protein
VWAKPLQYESKTGGEELPEGAEVVDVSVALLNRSPSPMAVTLEYATHLSHLPGWAAGATSASMSASVRDLWTHTANGTHTGTFTAEVEAHGVVMLLRLSRLV